MPDESSAFQMPGGTDELPSLAIPRSQVTLNAADPRPIPRRNLVLSMGPQVLQLGHLLREMEEAGHASAVTSTGKSSSQFPAQIIQQLDLYSAPYDPADGPKPRNRHERRAQAARRRKA